MVRVRDRVIGLGLCQRSFIYEKLYEIVWHRFLRVLPWVQVTGPTGTVPTSANPGHYSTIKDTFTCAHLNGCFICHLNTHL